MNKENCALKLVDEIIVRTCFSNDETPSADTTWQPSIWAVKYNRNKKFYTFQLLMKILLNLYKFKNTLSLKKRERLFIVVVFEYLLLRNFA